MNQGGNLVGDKVSSDFVITLSSEDIREKSINY